MSGRYCALLLLIGLCGGCGDASPPQLSGEPKTQVAPHLAERLGNEPDRDMSRMDEDRPVAPVNEAYAPIIDNPFLSVDQTPLSTFSIDVDTASYANVRRFLTQGQLPPQGAVRIEELLNYFQYDDPLPQHETPFSVTLEVAECPWRPEHRLARIGLRGREIPREERPVSNLVFLIDVSGSMQTIQKLPLVKAGLKLLVEQLGENDRVAIVVYAGATGLVLPSTTGDQKQAILSAIDHLQAGGSTNGGAGIELAYRVALENFIEHGVNRVILCTDGDFNVGVTSREQLVGLLQQQARSGIFVTVLGFGMGNYQDSMLETLADKGNGNYGYIDSLAEARKLLVEQLQGTLMTIAKDVKLQVEFNPQQVSAYRLIGYENRMLATADFQDDRRDAGEIGAGHSVTALYELTPVSAATTSGESAARTPRGDGELAGGGIAPHSDELFALRLRFKLPEEDESRLIEFSAFDRGTTTRQASHDLTWAAAVAGFGMLLRDSPHRGNLTLPQVLELVESSVGEDRAGHRREFLQLVRSAQSLLRSAAIGL
ncbi:MAG: vWA domain-containing protein [Planctomycetales bacterium]